MVRKIIPIFLLCFVALATSKQNIEAADLSTEIEVEDQDEYIDTSTSSGMSEHDIVVLASETAVETISDIYDEGTLNSTYTNYFRDYMGHLALDDHYIYARTGQYEYSLFYGNISLSGSTFSMADATRITITTTTGYNSNYSINSSQISNYTLDVGDNIVYSDLGYYPMFEGRIEVLTYVQAYSLCVIALASLLRSLFNFRRSRNH